MRVNPSLKREVIGRVASCDANHADLAVVSAADAFLRWSRQSPAVRAELVRQIGDSIRRHRFEWAAWQVLEVGKPWREADADVCEAIDFCEYYAESALMLGQERHRREPGEDNSYRYKPRGVAVAIAPWNFPLAILVGMTVGPLAAGCTVVVKPAEQASVLAARFFQTITDEVDLPTGVLHFVPGVGEVVGARLVEHPAVSVVSFTGSRAVGLNIIETAARTPVGQHHVKSVLAEMGGKNAVIVDDDADLDEAVLGVVQSAFGFSGQKCSACSRVIVLPHVREAFTARLIDAARAVVIGPAENPANTMGPVIDEDAHRRLFAVLEHARREGLTVEAGPATLSDGYFIEPHIILNASPKHRLAQEEFFGPILTLLPADSMDEAIAIANDTDYALTGGIYSRNPRHIEQVRDSLDVGNLYINRKITGAEVDRHPFGGHKLSGTGSKAGGPDYLRHFLIAQTITENTIRRGFAPQDD
jgi:RHH-type proline utilization regulon transcriptional repressor/proline dehydrogenase/delta 1-pyrroline-5-carboxylate dehydrogenase